MDGKRRRRKLRISYPARVLVAVLTACSAIAGCAGYRTGTLLPERYRTIGVPMFRNSTNEPNIEAMATNAVIERLNVDGTLRVVEHNPDLLLRCAITGYVRTPLRYAEGIHPQEYRLTITVSATLTDTRERKEIWAERLISGDAEFQVGADMFSSERAALPEVMEDLAHDIVEAVVEGW